MTNEKLLAKLHAIDMDITCRKIHSNILADLILTIEDEIRTETAKSRGQSGLLKTAKDILKVSAKGDRDVLKYADTASNGYQYICDGYRLLKISKPLPFPELPNDIPPFDYERLIPHLTNSVELELPDAAKLRAYVKIKKAEKQKAVYDFGAGFPVVSADQLLSMIEAFPEATATVEPSGTDLNIHPILFYSGDDFGMLMPLRANWERRKTEL